VKKHLSRERRSKNTLICPLSEERSCRNAITVQTLMLFAGNWLVYREGERLWVLSRGKESHQGKHAKQCEGRTDLLVVYLPNGSRDKGKKLSAKVRRPLEGARRTLKGKRDAYSTLRTPDIEKGGARTPKRGKFNRLARGRKGGGGSLRSSKEIKGWNGGFLGSLEGKKMLQDFRGMEYRFIDEDLMLVRVN